MSLSYLVFFTMVFAFSAMATVVIVDPYGDLDYNAIQVYSYNNCECPEYSPYGNYFNR